MRINVLFLLAAIAACGGDDSGNGSRDAGRDGTTLDAPEFGPMITSFVATPSMVPAGVPTSITWTWTYAQEPTVPDPTCSIDNGVGAVTRGQAISVTISTVTTFTLTCQNRAGMAQRQVVVGVPPVAPILATFTANTASIAPNTATAVTFSWTYANTPSPTPTCTIDGGATTTTSGAAVSLNLPQARTFRLKCSNGQGTVYSGGSVADVTVAVNECGTASADCNAHATCTDTTSSYSCTCASGYAGDGDTCTLLTDCGTTPANCDANATCSGGAQCICKAGYFGSGAAGDCKRARFTFVTSTSTTGAIGSLAAADAMCTTRATAASLPGTYVAWMSDATSDAYCRVHGLTGKKANNCGLGALPATAGPWVRVGDYKQWSPTIDKLLSPNHITYYPANTNESGVEVATLSGATLLDRVWTGTDDTGQYVPNATCGDWTSSGGTGAAGEVHGGGTSWTRTGATDAACANSYHLRCVEVSATPSPALPGRHPLNARKAFITSVSGTGNLSTWPDAYGQTSTLAPDAICQARARYAGYANASNFKAWLASYSLGTSPYYLVNHIAQTSYAYARPDGVVMGTTRADMLDSKINAAWEETEANTYLAGNLDAGAAWTGMSSFPNTSGFYYSSSSTYHCNYWTYAFSGYYAPAGRFDLLDGRAMSYLVTTGCDTMQRFYCVDDSP